MKTKTGSKKKEEVLEWKNKYLRALADYQNLERRISEQNNKDKKDAARGIIIKLLPVIDDLSKAQEELKNEGLKLILDKIDALLKSENVQRVNCNNQMFNPDIMECVGIVDKGKENEVADQVRPAYLINTEVIQAAQVIVSNAKKEKN